MPENAIIPEGAIPDQEVVVETAKAKFERERLSRRQALKKLGMTSAMAAFALFSVDDLARMVGKTMQQRAGDNKVAEQVAKELQRAGVTLADGPPVTPPYGPCPETYCICNDTCLNGLVDGRTVQQCLEHCAQVNPTAINCYCNS